jgi:hypothetical protein
LNTWFLSIRTSSDFQQLPEDNGTLQALRHVGIHLHPSRGEPSSDDAATGDANERTSINLFCALYPQSFTANELGVPFEIVPVDLGK